MRKSLVLLFLSSLVCVSLVSCSGIQILTPGDRSDLYSEKFLKEINQIKKIYSGGKTDTALERLKAFKQDKLRPAEQALRRNLIGVIQFSEENYEQAIFQFDLALSRSQLDDSLTAQIHLNLASSYYKLGQYEKAFSSLQISDFHKLKKKEAKKHYKLHYNLAKVLSRDRELCISLVRYLGGREKISQIKNDPLFQELISHFFELKKRDKIRLLENFGEEQNIVAGYLGYLDAEQAYYRGDKEEAKNLLDWVRDNYEDRPQIQSLVKNFNFRMENYTKMNQKSIGVVLPLSGDKKEFGRRALLGIDAGLKELIRQDKIDENFKLHIVDSEGSGAVGAHRVNELINKHHVSAVIGGLFSSEAEKEYREAKKRGVFFVSLAPIYIPKMQKNHLLLEVPGSIESQLKRLFSSDVLEKFGRKAAIVYPQSQRGEAYVNEFWRRSRLQDADITGVISYDKKATDFRDPIRNLLGLQHTRNREEEKEILKDIHDLEKDTTIRRVQTLQPQIDFDWVFIPAYPMEALQIIPSFSYLDAFDVKMFGGPSWRSKALSKESSKFGDLFFVGDDVRPLSETFVSRFSKKYDKRPRLIELRGYDAMKILDKLLGEREYPSRNAFERYLREKGQLSGLTGRWSLIDQIWVKDMVALKLTDGDIKDVFGTAEETGEGESLSESEEGENETVNLR